MKRTSSILSDLVERVEYTRHKGSNTTVCYITLKGGLVIEGQSICDNPADFNEEIGQRCAYDNAFDKLWELEGYHQKVLLSQANQTEQTEQTEFSFGRTVELLKQGQRVARKGWNGKGMFLLLVKGKCVTEPINDCCGDPTRYDYHPSGQEKGQPLPVLDAIYMKTADNKLVPWLASQTDVLSEDWVIHKE